MGSESTRLRDAARHAVVTVLGGEGFIKQQMPFRPSDQSLSTYEISIREAFDEASREAYLQNKAEKEDAVKAVANKLSKEQFIKAQTVKYAERWDAADIPAHAATHYD